MRGVGVQWVRTLANTYDVNAMQATLNEALSTDFKGPKVNGTYISQKGALIPALSRDPCRMFHRAGPRGMDCGSSPQ